MNLHPSSGYLLPLEKFRHALPQQHHKRLDALIASNANDEEWEEFFCSTHPSFYPWPTGILKLRQEDTSDSLEIGQIYVVFEQADLFETTLRPGARALMKKVDAAITQHQWATFS